MGVKQWVFQRLSNLLISLFGIWLLCAVITGGLNADTVQAIFAPGWLNTCLTILLVISCLNAVLAGWQISGDYAEKFGLNHTLLVGTAVVVSGAYLAIGLQLLL